jgi:hypothetical protein
MPNSRLFYRARTFYRRARAFLGRGWLSERVRIVTHDSSDGECTSPIFIVGTHRSGTSLLRRILDSHGRIACPPESFFLAHYTRMIEDRLTFEGLENLGFQRDEALKGLRRGASYFHEAYRLAKGKSRWADKTPQYVQHLETLYTLFGPRTQFVIIVRHPLDVAFSIWKRRWTFGPSTGDRVVDAANYVLRCGRAQLEFRRRHPQRCHTIHYDQLVRQPEQTLRHLCTCFLGEPWDENMMVHHRIQHDFGCEDPIVRGTPGFQGSFSNWHEWPEASVQAAVSILRDLIVELGYTVDSPFVRQVRHGGDEVSCETEATWSSPLVTYN